MARQVEVPELREVSEEDLEDLLNEGQKYLDELKVLLKDIKVPVDNNSPQVLEAIKSIFGNTYITQDNKSYVTFDMFLDCLHVTRNVGRAVAAEFA